MRLLFLGDVVGRSGRDAVLKHLPVLRKKLNIDFAVVNGENSVNGFGLSEQVVKQYLEAGANVITCGDHTFDQKETKFFIGQYPQMLRPHNFPSQLPGKGYNIYELPRGKKIMVIHLLAQLFIKFQVNCPFQVVTEILEKHKLGRDVDYIFVDFHGEATSEKMAMGQYLDGKVSAVSGSHTHVPTSDVMILEHGTAYQTDAGMCGDYDSVIGFDKDISIPQFLNKIRGEKIRPAEGEGTVCGFLVDIDEATGLAKAADYLRIGGKLREHIPNL
jgi:metallophosphoesterase (TIGR00282 family)